MKNRRHEGYLTIDHRASPGLPADIARQVGFDPTQCGEGQLLEAATMTCSHCQTAVVMNPQRTRARAYCPKCDHYICDWCHAAMTLPDYQHEPFAQRVDRTMDAGAHGTVYAPPVPLVTLI